MIIYTYEKINDLSGNERTDVILRVEDNAVIPTDPANSDYQEYLKSLKEETNGNNQ
jgi:hypothetical protein